MVFCKYSIPLICCTEYKNDPVVRDLYNIASDDCKTALNAYSSLCYQLLSNNVMLSDYMFLLTVNNGNALLKAYIKNKNEAVFKAIVNDIEILSALSRLKASDVVSYLMKEFDLYELSFPAFETGDTVVSADAVLSFAERYGSSLFAYNKAFIFENKELKPSFDFDKVHLQDLKNYNVQRGKLVDNTICFLNGSKAQNALLYGDRGTGKSSTVKAIVNEFDMLRIIQIHKSDIAEIYNLYELIRDNPLKFILFIDDITFGEDEEGYSFLKQVLEGSVVAMPQNCLIYATTNRRHIMKETASERADNELHAADTRDENMSLADRFGLYITFISPDKSEYLDIVRQIAEDRGIDISKEKLDMLAERYALKKCGRSPRTAKQFVDILESKLELKMELENL